MVEPGTDLNPCLARVRAGDGDAARELVEVLAPLVRRIVGAHLPWRAAPEDLCQDVFMKVFAKLDQYGGAVPFEHWVARVAVNTCRDRLRSQRQDREWRMADLEEHEVTALEGIAAAETAGETPDAHDAREIAGRLLASLEPDDRLVLTMIDLEQRTAAEVRALTGWSITGIRVRAFRARRKLRRQLESLRRS